MTDGYEELCSMLELCFGDEDDDEGLASLLEQLAFYPQRVQPVRDQLRALLDSGDRALCRAILEEYAHITATPDTSLEWFRWLDRKLAASGPC